MLEKDEHTAREREEEQNNKGYVTCEGLFSEITEGHEQMIDLLLDLSCEAFDKQLTSLADEFESGKLFDELDFRAVAEAQESTAVEAYGGFRETKRKDIPPTYSSKVAFFDQTLIAEKGNSELCLQQLSEFLVLLSANNYGHFIKKTLLEWDFSKFPGALKDWWGRTSWIKSCYTQKTLTNAEMVHYFLRFTPRCCSVVMKSNIRIIIARLEDLSEAMENHCLMEKRRFIAEHDYCRLH